MKTIKTILAIFLLAATANIGLAQKNVIVHQNTGKDLMTTTMAVDSITFSDFAVPGNAYFDTYTDSNTIGMEAHSKVTWDATYKGGAGVIAGGFDRIGADVLFDEANPANIKFDGWVDLSTADTYEPGREGPTHCVNTSLGITAGDWTSHIDTTYHMNGAIVVDTIITTVYDSVNANVQYASLSVAAGDVVRYGDGYMTTNAQFTYKGVTTSETVYFKYLGLLVTNYYVIEAEWQFDASPIATDPRSCGSNIKSTVHVKMHMKFHI